MSTEIPALNPNNHRKRKPEKTASAQKSPLRLF
jgi:hypothetical protein